MEVNVFPGVNIPERAVATPKPVSGNKTPIKQYTMTECIDRPNSETITIRILLCFGLFFASVYINPIKSPNSALEITLRAKLDRGLLLRMGEKILSPAAT